jgi:hypothetical protein
MKDEEAFEVAELFYEMNVVGISYDRQLSSVNWLKPIRASQFGYDGGKSELVRHCKEVVFHPVIAEANKMYTF